jgi:hypothetical protein
MPVTCGFAPGFVPCLLFDRGVGVLGRVFESVERVLDDLPEELQVSPTAMSALALAESIDLGTETYRFQSALVDQLRACMTELSAKAPAEVEGDVLDDLATLRQNRRSGAAS